VPIVSDDTVLHSTGSTLGKRNKKTMQIESFGYGFAFAFGMAVVRFLFAMATS
jgi:hypothetical protein